MVRSWLSLVLLLGLVCPSGAAYLERETLILDMTGTREVKTSLALQEHQPYILTMRSVYNLRPIWGALRQCNCVKYLLLVDGQSPSDNDRVSPWDYGHDMSEVTWRWWGKGTPLGVRIARDLTSEIRHATVEISRVKDPASTPSEVAGREAPPLWKQSPASGNFLEREAMALPTDGSAIHTTRPLEPYRMHLIAIRSPYDLSRLLGALQFDGGDARTARLMTPLDGHTEWLELRFAFRGRGTPLSVRLSKDMSDDVPHAMVEITLDADGTLTAEPPPVVSPVVVVEAPSSSSHRTGFLVILGIGLGVFLAIASGVRSFLRYCEDDERARERARVRDAADQRAADAARREAELKDKAVPWIARARAEVCFLGTNFQRVYARAHTDDILRTYRDTWESDYATLTQDAELLGYLTRHATTEANVPAWLDARMAVIELAQQAAVGLLPDDPPPPEPPTPDQAAQEQLLARAVGLQQQVHLERNFLDAAYREEYARKHMVELLAHEGSAWFSEYRALQADLPLLELVREAFPEVLDFYEARLEVYRIARRLEVTPPPPDARPPSTPEERQRKVTHFRNRLLQWRETKAQDFIAQRVQQLDMLRAFEEELAQYDLDEDERDRLLQEFRQELDLIDPPKPRSKPDDDKEDGDAGFATIRPDR